MNNSAEQIKEAPEPDERSQRIFRDFTDATAALMDLPNLPDGVETALAKMVDEFGNECGGNGDFDGLTARAILSRVFGLNLSADESRARREAAELAEDEALDAAERLAAAFATIREYWDYVPEGLHNCPLSTVSTELLNSVDWENSPRAYHRVISALLQAPEKENGAAAD